MAVEQIVLYVSHFVVRCHQKYAIDVRALLDPAEKPRNRLFKCRYTQWRRQLWGTGVRAP